MSPAHRPSWGQPQTLEAHGVHFREQLITCCRIDHQRLYLKCAVQVHVRGGGVRGGGTVGWAVGELGLWAAGVLSSATLALRGGGRRISVFRAILSCISCSGQLGLLETYPLHSLV